MSRHFAVALTLAISVCGFAQTPSQNSDSETQHYRLTFVVDSGQGEAGKQSFVLDVPIAPRKAGAARINLISGSEGDAQSVIVQSIQCNNVHPSTTGLALDIAMQSDRESPAIPGVLSARHQHGQFQRTVDLQLGKPTLVTEEMHFRVLGKTDPKLAEKWKQPAPTIIVTAEAL